MVGHPAFFEVLTRSRVMRGPTRRSCFAGCGTLSLVLFVLIRVTVADDPKGPLDIEPESLRPGLLAIYRSLDHEGASLHRVDLKPSFTLGQSSPHPRIPAGRFEVVWNGILQIQEPGAIKFDAFVGGELRVEIDGSTVLRGEGRTETSQLVSSESLTRPPGSYRLMIRYRSLSGVPARLQIFWEGPTFAREPLPAWRLSHRADEVSAALARDERAAMGRESAGKLGCARCHQSAFPGVTDPAPGPSLADASRRLTRDWVLRWLDDPAKARNGARMPALFTSDRNGYVERWIAADFLAGKGDDRHADKPIGNHRAGRLAFVGLGCAACHLVPDLNRAEQADPGRTALKGLGDRMSAEDLAIFLGNPHSRYPDGRMPRFPIAPVMARDIAAYLLMWAGKSPSVPSSAAPTEDEVRGLAGRLGMAGRPAAMLATTLLNQKGCTACHTGLGPSLPRDVPIRAGTGGGCPSGESGARYSLELPTRAALSDYRAVASRESVPSPFVTRQRLLARAGCVRCHQRDTDRPPPIEEIGRTLGGGHLYAFPYQRTPRLSHPLRKFTHAYLATAVREGVSGLRSAEYTYRMPAFGSDADALVQALAEADGDLTFEADSARPIEADPTVGTLVGPEIVGSQGYGCISCHLWNGTQFSQPDPGAVGPDLTRVVGRVRRDWFDRFLENPERSCPGTPMPAIFPRGQKPSLTSVLGGDSTRQRDALWSYLARGREAPPPKAPSPLPIASPAPGATPLVAQIPIRLPDGTAVEAICLLYGSHDLLVYDLAIGAPRIAFVGGRILRNVQGRTRQFLASGTAVGSGLDSAPGMALITQGKPDVPTERTLRGYDRLADGARVRSNVRFKSATIEIEETLRIMRHDKLGRLERGVRLTGIPAGSTVAFNTKVPTPGGLTASATAGTAETLKEGDAISTRFAPDREGTVVAVISCELPPAESPPAWEGKPLENPDPDAGSLERPGYRAVAYARPKAISGEDRIMPAAVAVDPGDGRVFMASLKTGELLVLENPGDDVRDARFVDYAGGLFQDALAMLAEKDALYVLHRRNLTRVTDTDGDGKADRFDRVAALPHGIADTYDYAYGLARDRDGGFILSYAPYANTTLAGSGGVVKLVPGKAPEEVAFGLRNPLGWCAGPEGEVFFTDNQGEWVAANKLCHVDQGRFYGFPNAARKPTTDRPVGKPAIWVPYGWAHSINGVTYDQSGGKFGPFAGQFFLAELMFGGAIIRADVERVNGQYQGACFPFWGKGLLGPVSVAFDPRGRLFVGGITEPGWMAQPDRGALFRIDFTGQTPFEMQTIRVLPRGFRITFTKPVDRATASGLASYRLEKYRYEFTGAYGSPELDRTPAAVERVVLSEDGRSVELTTPPLVKDHVYLVSAPGVRSVAGEALVNFTGAYTLNEIPDSPPPKIDSDKR
ncbi:MAG: Cytochrome c [Planctomycetota bacterium]|nr:Cytochrome c [Planctomycetota bacterium]